jgi:uncharacterized protein (DUF1499 family)
MSLITYGLIAFAALIVMATAASWVSARLIPRPENVNQGTLSPCPSTPNCVSTEATDKAHRIEPIPFQVSAEIAQDALLNLLNETPGVEIVRVDEGYIYAESRSPTMGFVDDMEFVVDAANQVIRFRSAARMGGYDFNKNRERMEMIREQLADVQVSNNRVIA